MAKRKLNLNSTIHKNLSIFLHSTIYWWPLYIVIGWNWYSWKVWRYQRSNQNPYIEEEQTTQWPKEKVQKGKQRSTKHTYKTKDRVTRTPLNTGDELRCSGRVASSCSTSDTRRVNLVTNPVTSREWGKDRKVLTTSGTYPWSFVTQIFHNGQLSHGGDHTVFEVMISSLPRGTLGSVASLLAATLYQEIYCFPRR